MRKAAAGTPTLVETAAIDLEVADLAMSISGPAELLKPLKVRYQPFSHPEPGRQKIAVEICLQPELFKGPLQPVTTSWGPTGFAARSYNFRLHYFDGLALVQADDDWRAVDAAVRILSSTLLLEQGVLMLHASAVAKGPKAYVFSGPSESGKTTLASMAHGGRAGSDELICVRAHGSPLLVFDTPFYNGGRPTGFEPTAACGLFFIRQDRRTYVSRLTAKEVVLEAWRNAFFDPENSRQSRRALEVCSRLARTAAGYHLYFTLDQERTWRCLETV